MRTLKKTLALVLVIAMALSIGVIGANAAFTDTADSDYSEAIDVMSGIGVINGMTTTTFDPTGSLTREQAAKIICYMMLGPTNAELVSSATSSSFDDVAADRWSAGYIEYCANLGIINGVGDNKFDPTGTLTTAAFTKMLLCALGYDAGTEGFTGSSWAINVASMAVTAGVYDSTIAISASTVCTREQACQLAYKALTSKTVQYTGGTEIVVGDITIKQGATRSYVANTADSGYLYLSSGSIATNDLYMQFCESHFAKLKYVASTADTYGRPSHEWYYGVSLASKYLVGTYANTPVLTYDTAVKPTAIKLALTNAGYATTGAVTFWTNGIGVSYDAAAVASYLAGTTAVGGNGCIAELYVNTSGVLTDVVVINTHFGTVTAKTTDTASTTTYDERTLTITMAGGAARTCTADPYNTENFDELYAAYVAAGTSIPVLVIPTYDNADPGVGNSAVALKVDIPETVTGKVTKKTSSNVYTIGGADYKLSCENTASVGVGSTGTYYLDTYGNIIAASTVSTANYLYLVQSADSYTLSGTTLVSAVAGDIIFTDGTTATVTLASVGGATATTTNATAGLYTYTTNTKGYYVLTPVSQAVNSSLSYTSSVVASGKYASSTTLFIFANWVYDSDVGDYVYDSTVTTTTGYANIGTLSSVVGSYVDANSNSVVEVVFISSKTAVTSAAYAYYLGTYSYDGTTYTYDFLVSGEASTMTNILVGSSAMAGSSAGMYTISGSTATAVNYTTSDVVPTTGSSHVDGKYGNSVILYNGGPLFVDGSYVIDCGASVPVYIIDSTAGTVSTGTASSLTAGVTGDISIATSSTAVTAIYIIQ